MKKIINPVFVWPAVQTGTCDGTTCTLIHVRLVFCPGIWMLVDFGQN